MIRSGVSGVAVLTISAFIFTGMFEVNVNASPSFHITTHTSEEIVGFFDYESSHVTFESRMETSQNVLVHVQVNGLILDASSEIGEDGQKKVVIIDGYGKALSPEDKRTLIALTGLLEKYLEPYKRQLPPHEGLLMATVAVSGDAPAGHHLRRREVQLAR